MTNYTYSARMNFEESEMIFRAPSSRSNHFLKLQKMSLNTLEVFGHMMLFRWDSNPKTKFKFNHCGVHLHNQHIHNLKFIKSKYQDFFFETDCGFYFSFLDKDFSFIENRTFRL